VLGATASGPWAFLASAILAPAPLLLAVRCLPLKLGVPLAFGVGVVARLIAGRGDLAGGGVESALVVSALYLVPFLIDRFCATWLLRAGFLAFPCAALVLASIAPQLFSADIATQLLHPAQHDTLRVWANDLSRPAVELALWILASSTSGLASVHNWVVKDPYTQEQRENGLKVAGSTALALFLALFAVGGWRLSRGADVTVNARSSESLVMVAGAAVVILLAMAWVARRRHRPV
jgi:hypothetical protein